MNDLALVILGVLVVLSLIGTLYFLVVHFVYSIIFRSEESYLEHISHDEDDHNVRPLLGVVLPKNVITDNDHSDHLPTDVRK